MKCYTAVWSPPGLADWRGQEAHLELLPMCGLARGIFLAQVTQMFLLLTIGESPPWRRRCMSHHDPVMFLRFLFQRQVQEMFNEFLVRRIAVRRRWWSVVVIRRGLQSLVFRAQAFVQVLQLGCSELLWFQRCAGGIMMLSCASWCGCWALLLSSLQSIRRIRHYRFCVDRMMTGRRGPWGQIMRHGKNSLGLHAAPEDAGSQLWLERCDGVLNASAVKPICSKTLRLNSKIMFHFFLFCDLVLMLTLFVVNERSKQLLTKHHVHISSAHLSSKKKRKTSCETKNSSASLSCWEEEDVA
jgi:hypothetical protein